MITGLNGLDDNMKKIMVVDDEPDQIYTLKYSLEGAQEEFELIPANSAMECLQKLSSGILPDIILLDIMMPEMSGWELYEKIRDNSKYNDIPIVFLTARGDKIAKNAGRFLGNDYVEKPYDIKDLIKRINDILDKK